MDYIILSSAGEVLKTGAHRLDEAHCKYFWTAIPTVTVRAVSGKSDWSVRNYSLVPSYTWERGYSKSPTQQAGLNQSHSQSQGASGSLSHRD